MYGNANGPFPQQPPGPHVSPGAPGYQQFTSPRPPASGIGKFVFWFQWVTPLITATLLIFGRGLFLGQELGFVTVILVLFVGPAWVILHWVDCGLTLIPVYVRRARALPTVSAILNLITIPLTFLLSMFIGDGTDSPDDSGYRSFASRVLGLNVDAVGVGAFTFAGLVLACLIAYLIMAFRTPKVVRQQM
ncbi:MAG: hypothetical protein ACTHXA_03705 [Gulosibacter sp.]|uniref:hypothetical protein n=1 Tax=Gulosibacter sp. TaxID=2817531 RepID=UPI003F8DB59C